MRGLYAGLCSLILWSGSALAQTPVYVSHVEADFHWDLQPFSEENAPTEHILTCGGSSVTVPMPATSIPVKDVVPGPGQYTCVIYARNGAGRQVEPDVSFPLFESGYTPGQPFQLAVLEEPPDQPEPPIMADPVWGSVSNTTYAVRTNTTVTAPSGITDGDLLIYVLFIGNSGVSAPTATPPSGFALPNGGTFPIYGYDGSFSANLYVWYKIASGESGNYTATHISKSSQGVVFRISGGDGAQPVATTNSGSGTTTTYTGLTTANNGAMVVVIGTDWADTTNNLSPPSGTTPTFTERLDVTLTYVAAGNLATAGATGNKTMTNNSTSGHPWTGVMLAVEPAAGGSAEVTPSTATLTTATFAPTVSATAHQNVTPSTVGLTTSTFAPTVFASDHQAVTPSTASLTTSMFAPTVAVTDHQNVIPSTAELTISANAPTVSTTAHQNVVPSTASLTIATFAPTVQAGGNQEVVPEPFALTLETFAPTVEAGASAEVTPETAALTLSTFAPTVSIDEVAPPIVVIEGGGGGGGWDSHGKRKRKASRDRQRDLDFERSVQDTVHRLANPKPEPQRPSPRPVATSGSSAETKAALSRRDDDQLLNRIEGVEASIKEYEARQRWLGEMEDEEMILME